MELFLQGGLYEGEWQHGQRHGLGVRLLRSGTYKVRGGSLPLSPAISHALPATVGALLWLCKPVPASTHLACAFIVLG